MPQMAPISWLILFIIFSITLIIFNIFNYYSMIPKVPNSIEQDNNNILSKNMSWKW